MLEMLPIPEAGKTGWPWTEESDESGEEIREGKEWPRISIVTPSFNHGRFIEETIRSVLLQNYPNLEYIIIDGGSSDETLDIIRKYEKWITFWVSESDNGQSDAINKGFKRSSGIYVNWICSDDMLCRNAINSLASQLPGEELSLFIGSGYRINNEGYLIDSIAPSTISGLSQLIDIGAFWRRGNSILQQACFYPLEAVRKCGYLNLNRKYTMDFELWGMIMDAGYPVRKIHNEIGIFRWYDGQKTSRRNKVTTELIASARSLILNSRSLKNREKIQLTLRNERYRIKYLYKNFRSFLGLRRRFNRLINA